MSSTSRKTAGLLRLHSGLQGSNVVGSTKGQHFIGAAGDFEFVGALIKARM